MISQRCPDQLGCANRRWSEKEKEREEAVLFYDARSLSFSAHDRKNPRD